jgi:hypothetical protein
MQLVHFLSKWENIDIDEFMKKLEEK